MDANALEQDRIDACSFMVMTADGPVSMCEHNAHRDDYILKPLEYVNKKGETQMYQPLREKKSHGIPVKVVGAAPAACGSCAG